MYKELPLVSILIPVYNRKELVVKAVESSINQTYQNIEIIIVDNFSNDGTWELLNEIVSQDKRIKIFRNESNIGPVRNWRRCLNYSEGDFIKFLYSDDLLSSNTIEELLKPLLLDENIGFSLCKAKVENVDNKFELYNYKELYGKISSEKYILANYFFYNMPVSPGCSLFRRTDCINYLFEDISNPLNIHYGEHGGGIDLLLFLFTAHNYSHIFISDLTFVTFIGSKDSFTLTHNLFSSYEFAKIHFLNETSKLRILYFFKLKLNRSNFVQFLNLTNLKFGLFFRELMGLFTLFLNKYI